MIVYDIIIVPKINIFKKKNNQKLGVGMIFGNAAGIFSKFEGSFLMISLKFFLFSLIFSTPNKDLMFNDLRNYSYDETFGYAMINLRDPSQMGIQDILRQFNKVGYHEICNFINFIYYAESPRLYDDDFDPQVDEKRIHVNLVHSVRRKPARNLFEVIIYSQDDSRLSEFINCFS